MNLSPLPIQKFFDNNGRPLVGGLLFTYAAGTTTKIATYKNQAGTSNTNPVVLDYRGEANIWLDQTLAYKFVLSPVGDTDPPTRPIWTVDNISAAVTYASLTQQIIGQILYPRTASEISSGVTPVNYAYLPGDFRRYGADPTTINADGTFNSGAADSTTAILNAFLTGHTVLGGGRNCGYKCSQSIPFTSNMDFDAQDCTIYWTEDVAGFTNATGAAVLYPSIRGRLRGRSNVANTHAMLDLLDVNRGYFDVAQCDRGVSGKSWAYAVRIRLSASTALWNKFMPMEVNAVTIGGISIEAANCNHNVFFGFRLQNDDAILLPYGVKITGGGDNYFFDLDLEASFSTNGAGNAYGVNFNTGTNNRIYGIRTEGYTNAASFYGVNYAGATAAFNDVYGHYHSGFGSLGIFTGLVAGNTYVAGGYNYTAAGSLTGLKGEVGWDSVSDRFKATTNGGGQRLVVQSPALDAQDLNGNGLTNVSTITLTSAASSPGASKINLGSTTATTVGAAGGASALPATPTGYWIINVGGTQFKIPYYAN